jgi:uncharacterized membrane protein YGL010W
MPVHRDAGVSRLRPAGFIAGKYTQLAQAVMGLLMHHLFRRQLAVYAQYHRDPKNCLTHYVGVPVLFVAVMLPLQAWYVPLASFSVPLAVLLMLPAVAWWIMLDAGVGITLVLLTIPLLAIAELIDRNVGAAWMWSIAAAFFAIGWVFQLLGHAVFERRRPAFVDDLHQTMIGPMFVAAKLLRLFGLREDLAAAMQELPAQLA